MEPEEIFSPVMAALALAVVFLALFAMLFAELPFAERLRAAIQDHTQKAMLAIALVATGGSLYYSEGVGFTPCDFCWFQRIMMYPLFVLLLVAVVTRSRLAPKYIVTLAVIGLGLSIYHYQLELFPEQGEVCSGVVSCTARFVEEFGFVSIPFMAGCGFLTILLLQVAEWRVDRLYERWYDYEALPEAAAVE
jgi:disulfide bond formation protein DsbB